MAERQKRASTTTTFTRNIVVTSIRHNVAEIKLMSDQKSKQRKMMPRGQALWEETGRIPLLFHYILTKLLFFLLNEQVRLQNPRMQYAKFSVCTLKLP